MAAAPDLSSPALAAQAEATAGRPFAASPASHALAVRRFPGYDGHAPVLVSGLAGTGPHPAQDGCAARLAWLVGG